MAYPIKTFDQLRSDIIQEIQNLTGLTLDDEDDAAIRADGEAAVVEGLIIIKVIFKNSYLLLQLMSLSFIYMQNAWNVRVMVALRLQDESKQHQTLRSLFQLEQKSRMVKVITG